MNRIGTVILLMIVLIPVLLFILEFYLCKKDSKWALIIPMVVACFFILLGFYAVIISGTMFGIYFVYRQIEKDKQSKKSEIDKMNIQDLD